MGAAATEQPGSGRQASLPPLLRIAGGRTPRQSLALSGGKARAPPSALTALWCRLCSLAALVLFRAASHRFVLPFVVTAYGGTLSSLNSGPLERANEPGSGGCADMPGTATKRTRGPGNGNGMMECLAKSGRP
jgi:hypothetical protein